MTGNNLEIERSRVGSSAMGGVWRDANTRRVKRALLGLFQGAVGKDVVSRAWRKVKVD